MGEDSQDYEKFGSLSCGAHHCIAASCTGYVYTWGWNSDGQLGHGNRDNLTLPTKVMSLEKETVSLVGAGWRNTVVLCKGSNKLYMWGTCSFNKNGSKINHKENRKFLNESTVPLMVPWAGASTYTITSLEVTWSRMLSATYVDCISK